MKVETAGLASNKTGHRFSVVVRDGEKQDNYVYDVSENYTLNQIELLAIKFAIMGVGSEQPATITTASNYVSDMLEKNIQGWVKTPKSNTELIEEIRALLDDSSVQLVLEKSETAKTLCKSK